MRIRTRPLGLSVAVCAILTSACPHQARAQFPADGSAVASRAGRPIAGWVSAGVGPGHIDAASNSTIAGVVRASVSAGSLLLTYRHSDSDVGPVYVTGPGVRSDAVLVGARTNGRRIFGSAALGYARAARYHRCDQCGPTTVESGAGEMAYDLTMHANLLVPGIAVSISGDLGPARGLHSALTLELELGWFGH